MGAGRGARSRGGSFADWDAGVTRARVWAGAAVDARRRRDGEGGERARERGGGE